MKLNKVKTEEALSLTKPSYSIPPELEAAWLGYKHSLENLKAGPQEVKEENEEFWRKVVGEVELGLEGMGVWKRGEMDVKRGHGVPLSGRFY